MESHSFSDATHSIDQVAERTVTTTPPSTFEQAITTPMFNNAKSLYIAGGSFSVTNNILQKRDVALKLLHKRASANAILNAGGRVDEVKCHPGTREEVIDRIEKWRDSKDTQTTPILWLSGPAGAGKTAIVQTLAERCIAQDIPQANFFFFRADPSRNCLPSFVATLVHQITLLYPAQRDRVADELLVNPLILDSSLKDQLTRLIVAPLQTIYRSSSSYRRPIFLVDGLDECESEDKPSQRQILQAFDEILAKNSCLFRLLVASRDESQIRAAFNGTTCELLPIYLDEQYKPENDIRAFVIYEFQRIRKTHPLAHTLDTTWPSPRDIDDIVSKSSGQFVYAATVMRFIADSPASPELSLTRVQGAAQISVTSKSPFSHLDAMYTFILSRVDDQEVLKDVLHAQMLITNYQLRNVQGMLIVLLQAYNPKYTEAVVHSCLTNLTPIARCKDDFSLLFYHASFPDYLLDRSRSIDYFVDVDPFNFKSQPGVWKAFGKFRRYTPLWVATQGLAHSGLINLRELPPGFLNTLMTVEPSFFDSSDSAFETVDLFKQLYDLCSRAEDVTNYKRILHRWIKEQPLGYYIQQGYPPIDSKWPPCSRRYLAMASISSGVALEPLGWIDHALCPETESDLQETTLWLNDLLHRIHREHYHDSIEEYNRLMRTWASWATWNDIPLDGVQNLPNAWWYFQRSRLEKWGASRLGLGSRPE